MSLTAKQEKFCQGITKGLSQADAYRAAYAAAKMKPETVQNNAYMLMKDSEVAARVVELRRPVVEKLQYGLEQAMLEAEDALNVCKSGKNGGAMVSAVTLRAKLNGLLIDRKEVKTGPIEGAPVSELLALQEAIALITRARAEA